MAKWLNFNDLLKDKIFELRKAGMDDESIKEEVLDFLKKELQILTLKERTKFFRELKINDILNEK